MVDFTLEPVKLISPEEQSEREFRRAQAQIPTGDEPMAPGQFTMTPVRDAQPEKATRPWMGPDDRGRSMPRQAMDEALGGFNNALAQTIGAPVAAVNNIYQGLIGKGLEQDGMLTSTDVADFLKEQFAAIGGNAEAVDSLVGQMGEDLFFGMVSLGMGTAVGMGMKGTGTIPSIIRDTSRAVAQRPGLAATAEFGAAGGAAIGEHYGPEGIGRPLGAIVGGAFATIPMIGARREVQRELFGAPPGRVQAFRDASEAMARGDYKTANDAYRAMIFRQKPAPAPLVELDADISATTAYAQNVATRWQRMNEKALIDTLEGAKIEMAQGDPAGVAEQLRTTVMRAYGIAQQGASKLWSNVDMTQQATDIPLLKKFVRDEIMKGVELKNIDLRERALPLEVISEINKLQNGKVTLNRLKQIRSEAMALSRENKNASDTYHRNLDLIIGRLTESMDAVNPGDPRLKEAASYTQWIHDTFTRGPVGSKFLEGRPTHFSRDAIDAMQSALRQQHFGDVLADARMKLNVPQIEAESAQFIRETVRDIAEHRFGGDLQKGSDKVVKYLTSAAAQRFMRAFPKVESEFALMGQTLSDQLTARSTFTKSHFAKLTNSDPNSFVRSMWGSGDKVQRAAQITERVRNNPAALEGWKRANIGELFKRGQENPLQVEMLWQRQDVQQMMGRVLSRTEMNRLNRIISDGAEIVRGGEGFARRQLRRPMTVLSAIVGAAVGRSLNTGTIQAPGLVSSAFQRVSNRLLLPVEPTEMMANAVFSPQWEVALHASLPSNVTQAERLSRQLVRLIETQQATIQTLMDDALELELPDLGD